MREHLGLDVDAILEQERQADLDARAAFENEMGTIYRGLGGDDDEVVAEVVIGEDANISEKKRGKRRSVPRQQQPPPQPPRIPSFNHEASDLQHVSDSSESDGELDHDAEARAGSRAAARAASPAPSSDGPDPRVQGNAAHEREVDGYGPDRWKSASATGLDQGRDSVIVDGREVLVRSINAEGGRGTLDAPHLHGGRERSVSRGRGHHHHQHGQGPSVGGGGGGARAASRSVDPPRPTSTQPPASHPLVDDILLADIGQDCMRDPLDPGFVNEVWNRVAENNTLLYRCIFRCQPDSDVLNWTDYQMAKKYNREMIAVLEGDGGGGEAAEQEVVSENAPTGPAPPTIITPDDEAVDEKGKAPAPDGPNGAISEKDATTAAAAAAGDDSLHPTSTPSPRQPSRERHATFSSISRARTASRSSTGATTASAQAASSSGGIMNSVRHRKRATTKGSLAKGGGGGGLLGAGGAGAPFNEMPTRDEAEELIGLVQGTLVQFPYRWLEIEDENGNWGYPVDGVAPLAI
jgi:phospholipase D1/2